MTAECALRGSAGRTVGRAAKGGRCRHAFSIPAPDRKHHGYKRSIRGRCGVREISKWCGGEPPHPLTLSARGASLGASIAAGFSILGRRNGARIMRPNPISINPLFVDSR
jgi:hypothetical protein